MGAAIGGALAAVGGILAAKEQSRALDKARMTEAEFRRAELEQRQQMLDIVKREFGRGGEAIDILFDIARRFDVDERTGHLFRQAVRPASEQLVSTGNLFGARAPEVYGNLGLNARLAAEQQEVEQYSNVAGLSKGLGSSAMTGAGLFQTGINQATGNIATLQAAKGAVQAGGTFDLFSQLGSITSDLGDWWQQRSQGVKDPYT